MAVRFSTGLKNAAGSMAPQVKLMATNTIAFVASTQKITDSANGFLSKEYCVGDVVSVVGSASNNGEYTVTAVSAGELTVEEVLVDEAAGSVIALAAADGGSLADIFNGGVLVIFTGVQPASADNAETGAIMATVTKGGVAHNTSTGENGLLFQYEPGDGKVSKKAGQVWSGTVAQTGTMGWARLYSREHTTGSSTSAIRMDMSVGSSGADLKVPDPSMTAGQPFNIDQFYMFQP